MCKLTFGTLLQTADIEIGGKLYGLTLLNKRSYKEYIPLTLIQFRNRSKNNIAYRNSTNVQFKKQKNK